MALNSYMTLTGATQGEIKGSTTQAGREDQIEIYGWSHEIVSPRDAASGLPTGKRQHKPITITKAIDRATPALMTALASGEAITELVLRAWRPSKTGAEEQYYTIKLTDAAIAGIRQEQLNNKYPENMQHQIREHITFTYKQITWTWMEGGLTAEDDWEQPRT